MENKGREYHIEDLGDNEEIANGLDSNVYSVIKNNKETITKGYERMLENFTPTELKFVLENYYADTERAQKLLENHPNPLNQFIDIDGRNLPVEYIVVPQGGIFLPRGWEGHESPLVAKQKFIGGANLKYLQRYDTSEFGDQRPFNNKDNKHNLRNLIEEVFNYINSQLNVKFDYADVNVKPFLKDDKITVYITDLAMSIEDYYLDSPRIHKYLESQE